MNEITRFRKRKHTTTWRMQLLLVFQAIIISCLSVVYTTTARDVIPNNNENEYLLGKMEEQNISEEALSRFIDLSTNYLVRSCHQFSSTSNFGGSPTGKGQFTYIAHLDEPLNVMDPPSKYNLLRHNGAIFALALSYQRSESLIVTEAMRSAIDYLRDASIGPVPLPAGADTTTEADILPNLLAPWERNSKVKKHAKLGGAGLALVAMVSFEQVSMKENPFHVTDKEYLGQLRSMAEFIGYMQKDDGSFTSKYNVIVGKDESFNSLYYPGEAALGLLFLASIETDNTYQEKWLNIATNALLYLAKLRQNMKLADVEPDHWALIATAKILPLIEKKQDPETYRSLYDHGIKVVKSILSSHTRKDLKNNDGCFYTDHRTCPTATRLEGLLAAMEFVKEEEVIEEKVAGKQISVNLRRRMIHDLSAGISFLLEAQETDTTNNMHGAMPVSYFPRKSKERNNRSVRVDYVQHTMTAVIGYEKLLSNLKEKEAKPQLSRELHLLRSKETVTTPLSSKTPIPILAPSTVIIFCFALFSVIGAFIHNATRKKRKLKTTQENGTTGKGNKNDRADFRPVSSLRKRIPPQKLAMPI